MTTTQLTPLRYETATVTLDVTAQEAAVSQWSDIPVVQVLRYHLSIREIDSDALLAEIRGDRASFLPLVDAVQYYIQGQLTPVAAIPTAIASADAPVKITHDSQFRLEPQGFTRHVLHLGSLKTIAGDSDITLGTTQLADLGDVFDQLESQVRCLPVSLVSEQRNRWRTWGTAAAGIVAAVGITTSLWPLYQSQQLTETAFEAPISDQSIPESAASPELERTIVSDEAEADSESTDETPSPSDTPASRATESIEKPENTAASEVVKQLPPSRATPTPPDFEISRPQSKPSNSENRPASPPLATAVPPPAVSLEEDSPPQDPTHQPETFAVDPSLSQTSPSGSVAAGDRPEATTESSEVPREPTLPTTRGPGTTRSVPSPVTEDAESTASSGTSEILPGSGQPNSAEIMDAIPTATVSPAEAAAASPLDLETLATQLTEAWRPSDILERTIAYVLTLAPDGSITQIESEDDLAEQYRDRVPLPDVGTSVSLPRTQSQVRILFHPDGSVEAFPFGAN